MSFQISMGDTVTEKLRMPRLNYILYKLILAGLIGLFFCYLHQAYTSASAYGDAPFYAILVFTAGLIAFLPRTVDKIAYVLLSAFGTIYFISEEIYFSEFHDYIAISGLLSQTHEAGAYSYMLKDLLSRVDLITIALFVLGLICAIGFVKTDAPRKSVLIAEICIALCVTAIVPYSFYQAYHSTIPDAQENGYGDGYIYKYMPSAVSFVSLFGMEEFLLRDIRSMIGTAPDSNPEIIRERISSFMKGRSVHQDNAMTGVFADKSLIVIQAESLSTFAIDKTLTPTLYKLRNEGWDFENFLAPLRNGSTSATEVMANTGLFPSNDGNIVSIAYADNTYPTALAKMFAGYGYDTDAFHNNFANYYNRQNFYPAIGYCNFMDPYRMQVENIESDYWCSQKIAWMDFQDPRYFTFWVTYSGHQDYLNDFNDPEKYGPHCAE
ncbi:MAG: hypothetical protein EOM64_09605, partial [Erysipelotrichia bacterium]|nr:hypothetical protein [Erysipelotrichia bacterium]